MASARPLLAPSSSSPAATATSTTPRYYHVFLSFRGSDTRKNFTDHLYTTLKWLGIRTFRDDQAIEKGEDIVPEIEKAIEESQMSLIVFSTDFASSEYCLDEVVKIMECRRTMGHVVLPIFYNVDPGHVSDQTGTYAEAFSKHELRHKGDRVQEWRTALKEVSDIAGMILGDRHEAEFVQDIVKIVESKLKRAIVPVPSYLVGVELRTEGIDKWLKDESDDVGIAMIYGIAGVGKTTTAKIVFNLNFQNFEVWSFLPDVNETARHRNGLIELQRRLLQDISKGNTSTVSHMNQGIFEIELILCNRRALIVLDDVGNVDQLDAVIRISRQLYKGSKVIITTTRQDLLQSYQACKKFRIEELDEGRSLLVFSWHAFRQPCPPDEYENYSKRVVEHCCGLPLALEVLGCCLSSLSINLWRRAVQAPAKIDGSDKIQRILRVCYDSLENERDKILFLDIACFFLGKDKDYVDKVLDSCDYYRPLGIQQLVDRNMISIGACNKLAMHQLLRHMGREIVHSESLEDPGKRSRIWHYKDASRLLDGDLESKRVKSLILDLPPSDSEWTLEADVLAPMKNLKLLQLNNVNLIGNYKKFPHGLIWLCMQGCPLNSLPAEFSLKDLVVLEMPNNNIRNVCNNAWFLPELKVLDLSHSCTLTTTPHFAGLPNLEMLILKSCAQLVEVHPSIGILQGLAVLDLSYCVSLMKLPHEIRYLTSLEVLDLSGCTRLEELLEPVKMTSSSLMTEDASTSNQRLLRENLKSSSPSLACLPRFLVSLSLSDCNIHVLPENLTDLSSLRILLLDDNPLSQVPEGIKDLKMLSTLSLSRCSLVSLPKLPSSLQKLLLFECRSLKKVTNLPNFSTSLTLGPTGCGLVEVQGSFRLEPITKVYIDMMSNLGLLDYMGPLEGSQVRYLNRLTLRKMTFHKMQILHEFGISSIFCTGGDIPSWFNHQTEGKSLSLDVPTRHGHRFCGLILCVAYVDMSCGSFECSIKAEIVNRTKRVKWRYRPVILGIPYADVMLWLSHWRFEHQIQSGDHVEIKVDVGEDDDDMDIWGCGVQFMYKTREEEEGSSDGIYTRALCELDLSAYEVGQGAFILDNSSPRRRIDYWVIEIR